MDLAAIFFMTAESVDNLQIIHGACGKWSAFL